MPKPLPIGIQTFRTIIDGGYTYVDKTEVIYKLVSGSPAIFLSRPRRFGKSLLLSTLEEIFRGNKELFKDLWIYKSDYNWQEHPVIRFDFSKMKPFTPDELKAAIISNINDIANSYELSLSATTYELRFAELIRELSKQQKVVILIDEYDKPIIDNITDLDLATQMREVLKGFYTIVKAAGEYIRFVLLTGVSKFSKAGVFSGLNHLMDISMNRKYSAIAGITQQELEQNFVGYIEQLQSEEELSRHDLLEKIKLWYNGYCFSEKCTQVYNPFSLLLLFENLSFRNFWFETGTPSFLVSLMKSSNYNLAQMPIQAEVDAFSTYEVENLAVTPLLFQAGYLTLTGHDRNRELYTLDFPNIEVRKSFLNYLAKSYTRKELALADIYKMTDALAANDFEQFFTVLKTFFANIDYDLHLDYEKYYQTIFYVVFNLIGLNIKAEVKTNLGRINAVIESDAIFIFEFKFDGSEKEALEQIREKKYAEKYAGKGKKIFLVGVCFAEKNIKNWIIEEMI